MIINLVNNPEKYSYDELWLMEDETLVFRLYNSAFDLNQAYTQSKQDAINFAKAILKLYGYNDLETDRRTM